MTTSTYDGTGKLAEALAALCGYSPKSQGRTAELIKQAKDGLNITSKAKLMPTDTKLAIWQWHYDRLHSNEQPVEIISQLPDNEPVEIISQAESSAPVEIYSQANDIEPVEIISQPEPITPVEIIAQLDDDDPTELHNLDIVRVAFYVTKDGKRLRQVIALDGFYINGLIAATGITRQGVPKWIQAATNEWGAFDAHLPITRQVKYLIVRTMTEVIEATRK
ncbi:MAG: hypothetical protein Q7U38_13145 [Methylobacter sp.]|nr:hypothetical protein [Methylobacter sp.]MDP2099439.1 hypothetical protein [Methylobacter sp.]MDP2430108.1 hypothetical protein [Methylobacter sp.]MDP3054290.1 hypothetical protein [Methylobacter sp.]MDP3362529.1 hypothetical protein [Methylobacter sp.]